MNFFVLSDRKKIPLLVVLALAFTGCLIVMLPSVAELIVQNAQVVLRKTLRKPEKWINVLTACSHLAFYFVVVIAFLNFTGFGQKIALCVKEVFSDFFSIVKSRESISVLALLGAFFLFSFYRVFDADYLYIDDVFRHMTGSRSWIGFSRYVSEFFSMFLHTGVNLSDIAPLAQFFAIVLMVFEVALVSYILNKKISLPLVFALSLIFINPLFAQSISYRFDAPYMTMAIVFPTIPFLFCNCKEDGFWIFGTVSFFFLILCNITYQASASVYIILSIFEVYNRLQNKKDLEETIRFALTTVFAFALALLFFKFFLMVPIDEDEYFSAKIKIGAIGKNIILFIKAAFFFFGGKWTKIFLVLVFVFSFIEFAKDSKQKKSISFFLTLAMFVLFLSLFAGAYIVFEVPLFLHRTMGGFCFLLGLMCAKIFLSPPKNIARISVCLLAFGCIVFYYAYGNVLRDQRIYQDFRAEILLSDLNKFADGSAKKTIAVIGNVGYSLGFENAVKTFPTMAGMILPVPRGGGTWNDDILNFYNFNCEDSGLLENPGFPLLLSTNYHDIYGEENNFFVVLK